VVVVAEVAPLRTLRALALLGVVCVAAGCRTATPDADRTYLADSWKAYRAAYIASDGYVLDRTRNGGEVTSEGQSYALLRAAWMGDRETFDRVLGWTRATLQRPDGLFSWLWSPRDGGRVLDVNSATDADQDIAFALLVASRAFDRPAYVSDARRLLRAIRTHERLDVPGGWFIAAGNWAPAERISNLSYFVPYAYPYFDRVDPDGRWLDVLRVGYDLLRQSVGQARTQLPPDFLVVSLDGTVGHLPPTSTLGRAFSFDSVRIPWRVALDCQLHGRANACVPGGAVPGLVAALRSFGRLVSAYDPNGTPLTADQSLSFYACLLPVLAMTDVALARDVRRTHLSLDALTALSSDESRYYDLNWTWFGIASVTGLIQERTPLPTAF